MEGVGVHLGVVIPRMQTLFSLTLSLPLSNLLLLHWERCSLRSLISQQSESIVPTTPARHPFFREGLRLILSGFKLKSCENATVDLAWFQVPTPGPWQLLIATTVEEDFPEKGVLLLADKRINVHYTYPRYFNKYSHSAEVISV